MSSKRVSIVVCATTLDLAIREAQIQARDRFETPDEVSVALVFDFMEQRIALWDSSGESDSDLTWHFSATPS